MIAAMDEQVGRVAQALEDGGIARDTIIIFTSDNGGGMAGPKIPSPISQSAWSAVCPACHCFTKEPKTSDTDSFRAPDWS